MLTQDFKELFESLNADGVRYLVVGGYAVAFHGHPRHTKDIEVWVDRSPENAARLLKAIDRFGFGALDLQPADFLEPDQVIQLGVAPNRIDLLTTVRGVDFETCYRSRATTTFEGVPIQFIDRASLKTSKRAAGRHQDLADVENLEAGEADDA